MSSTQSCCSATTLQQRCRRRRSHRPCRLLGADGVNIVLIALLGSGGGDGGGGSGGIGDSGCSLVRAHEFAPFDAITCWSANTYLDKVRRANVMGPAQPAGLYRTRLSFDEAEFCRVLVQGNPALNVAPLVVRA